MELSATQQSAPQRCGHCGRTSHGMACCGMLGLIEGNPCQIDHTTENEPAAPAPPVQHGPTPPRRPVRRIDPRGTR